MNNFVNRVKELKSLRDACGRHGASLYILYGRRRLGKTTLLREFSSGLPSAVYHMADRSTEQEAIRMMAESMSRGLNEPTLMSGNYRDWYALFSAYDRFRPRRKSVLIIDEYQYLCEMQPAFSSIMQKWWDEHWQKSEIMVVLSGSVLSMMYKETLSHSSPLFGRRVAQWLLTPFRFSQIAEFFPKLSSRRLVEMWSLTGGVPHYAMLASGVSGFDEAVRELVLTKGGSLYEEAKFLLADDVTTPNTYWSLLHCIGNGVSRISEIAGRLGMPASQLTSYMSALRDLGWVKREVSVAESNPARSKRGIYQITDPFLRLWFGCVLPYESLLEFGKVDEVCLLMRDRLALHKAWAFEEVCRQYVEDLAERIGVVRVGRFWNKACEIDVAAVNSVGDVVFAGECKASVSPIGLDVARELEHKVERAFGSGKAVRLAIFSAGGFTEALREWSKKTGALIVDADDIASGKWRG